jgi:hypothetical protein
MGFEWKGPTILQHLRAGMDSHISIRCGVMALTRFHLPNKIHLPRDLLITVKEVSMAVTAEIILISTQSSQSTKTARSTELKRVLNMVPLHDVCREIQMYLIWRLGPLRQQ